MLLTIDEIVTKVLRAMPIIHVLLEAIPIYDYTLRKPAELQPGQYRMFEMDPPKRDSYRPYLICSGGATKMGSSWGYFEQLERERKVRIYRT